MTEPTPHHWRDCPLQGRFYCPDCRDEEMEEE